MGNFESAFTTTLTKKLNPSDITISIENAVSIGEGRIYLANDSQDEFIEFESTADAGLTLGTLTRNLSKTADPATGGTGLTWLAGSEIKIVAMHDQIVDKLGDNTFQGLQTFVDIDFTGTTTGGLKVKSLTTTERNAITNVSNGMILYDSTIGELYQYIGGAWSAVSAGSTQANASETVAGKIELPTDAQVTAKTATGETGATVCPTNAQTGKSVALKVVNATLEETDHIVFDNAGTDNKMLISVLRNQLAASESIKGTVEKLTDTEFDTATDITRYVTSDQANFINIVAGTNLIAFSALTEQTTTSGTYTKVKEVKITKAGAYSIGFEIKSNGGGSIGYGKIYKNGIALGPEYSEAGAIYVEHIDDYTFAKGDLVQLYIKEDSGASFIAIQNFKGTCDLQIGIVNLD